MKLSEKGEIVMKPVLDKLCELLYIVLKADIMTKADICGFLAVCNIYILGVIFYRY
jgi:hypothetical protein